jgi:hypothetical protein
MPTEAELPSGSIRDFAMVLFDLYREAHRPPLRQISAAIDRRDDRRGTASAETIRRMLNGTTVPASWPTVEAVLLALCELGGTDPDQACGASDYPDMSWREALVHTWHRALDFPDEYHHLGPVQPDGTWPDDPPF